MNDASSRIVGLGANLLYTGTTDSKENAVTHFDRLFYTICVI